MARASRHPIEERDETVAGARGHLYIPKDIEHPPAIVLIHGVHWKSIDDPRLHVFASSIAESGVLVLTPEIRELADYRIDPASIVTIGASVRELSAQMGGGRVGLLGLSFGGGLSLIAATDPTVSPHLRFVATIGAHDDLGRVLRFFVSDEAPRPDGTIFHLHAHDYGTVVLEYSHVEDFFTPVDVDVARDTLRFVLHERFEEARERSKALSPEGAAKMKLVFDHDVHAMAPELLREVEHLRPGFDAVSPDVHMNALRVPAFVLHGFGDTVIPSSEAEWLGHDIPRNLLRADLVSHAIEHVALESATPIADEVAVIHFMSQLLGATDD